MEKRLGYWRAFFAQLKTSKASCRKGTLASSTFARASWGRSSATMWTSSTRGHPLRGTVGERRAVRVPPAN
eukprot:7007835-Alexandrium_andersonii.AAC.1